MATRFVVGALCALIVAAVARRSGALTWGGAVAAGGVGAAGVAAGWSWGALLLAFFLTSVGWSRFRAEVKRARAASVLDEVQARTASQVLANGSVFGVSAVVLAWLSEVDASSRAAVAAASAALGALAAATADTWGTELGLLSAAHPRSVLTGRELAPGISGGVTLVGTLAGIAGALGIAVSAALLGVAPRVVTAGFAGGIIGFAADSLLGAGVQARRWCDGCGQATERRTHACGAPSRAAGGISWLGNDAVNALATATGAAAAAVMSAWMIAP